MRLRLVSLRVPGVSLDIGGGHACVHTAAATRTDVADAIAHAVIGPRAPGVDGTVEIAGRLVALLSLPAPLLTPSAAPTIDDAILSELWRRACTQRRTNAIAAHEACRRERHRTATAIERARVRAEELRAAPVASDAMAAGDIAAAEDRVRAARLAVARASRGIVPEFRARIDEAHRAVVDAERDLFDAGRKERPEALARYQAALADERAALAEAGVDSYATLLVSVAVGGATVDAETRLRAELELAEAEQELANARAANGNAQGLREQRRALRAEAESLLRELAVHDAQLRDLEREADLLDLERARPFTQLSRDRALVVLDALVESYRASEVLAGRLPLVFDGAFDAVRPDVVTAAAQALTALDDIQTIVVTSEPSVAQAFAASGAAPLVWGPAIPDPCGTHLRLLRRRGA